MELCAIASGSSGNCFYIGNSKLNQGIIVDAGISARQFFFRMAMLNRSPESIKGIFITHEHKDHVKGADVLARRFNIPIFATKKTAQNNFLCSDESLLNTIKNNESIDIAGMTIEAFPKSHHADDPVSFNIQADKKASIITDAVYACKNIAENVLDSDFLFLESNHDENMLVTGKYPYFLKKLIKSDIGHLSNKQAALCVLEYASPKLKHIVLSHLSKVNNTQQLALKTFHSMLNKRKNISPDISVSLGEEPTNLFKI